LKSVGVFIGILKYGRNNSSVFFNIKRWQGQVLFGALPSGRNQAFDFIEIYVAQHMQFFVLECTYLIAMIAPASLAR
jgi:hypothetical protein